MQGNPALAFDTSILMSQCASPSVEDLLALNKLIRLVKTMIVAQPERCAFITMADAVWANRADGSFIATHIVLMTHPNILKGELTGDFVDPSDYESYLKSIEAMALNDCKSLVDVILMERSAASRTSKDKKMAIEMTMIKWVDNRYMAADILSKEMARGNVQNIQKLLQERNYQIRPTKEKMQERAQAHSIAADQKQQQKYITHGEPGVDYFEYDYEYPHGVIMHKRKRVPIPPEPDYNDYHWKPARSQGIMETAKDEE